MEDSPPAPIKGQTSIAVPEQQKPDPEGKPCHWCGAPATIRIEFMRKTAKGMIGMQQFMHVCDDHERIAKQVAIQGKKR